jgi:hypothetical protein
MMAAQPRHLDLLSGPWCGLWQQIYASDGHESLDLVFQSGQVLGFGTDEDGQFQYSGIYDAAGAVILGKTYTRAWHPVPARMTYRGQWNGRRIQGTWTDDSSADNAGPFRLWPGTGPDPGEVLEEVVDIGVDELVAVVVTSGSQRTEAHGAMRTS